MVAWDAVSLIFSNLDRWRHFPNYQLERRVDVLFSVYLKGLLEDFTGRPMMDIILPEFPIRRDLVCATQPSGLSIKVDYVLFSQDRQAVYFVELKTDQSSRRTAQDKCLEAAKRVGFAEILRGLVTIVCKTDSSHKYYHLLYWLSRAGFLGLPLDIEDYLYPVARRGLASRLNSIKLPQINPPIRVVYIMPHATPGLDCIDFGQVVSYLNGLDDDFARLFAASLSRWRETPVGTIAPGTVSIG